MSLEAEQSVIGGLLQDNSMLDLINLSPENFEGLDNRIIFDAILATKLSYDIFKSKIISSLKPFNVLITNFLLIYFIIVYYCLYYFIKYI